MIWATVRSWFCFCWLYRASPSGCKENNQSDFGIDHLVMSTYRVFSYVIGRTCLLWSVHSLGKTLLAFALLHSVLQGQICLLFQVFLTSYFCIPVPFNEKDIFFGVLEDLVCLHRTVQLQLLQHYWLGQTWITTILNGFPWKRTGIILSFLRLHPSITFWTLSLTMMATPFLLRDSCQQ